MNHAQVAHRWAAFNTTGTRRSEAKASRVFFHGASIYSYGHHWKLAQFHDGPGRTRAVLLNSGTYSVTTSKHARAVADAVRNLPGVTRFRVPNVEANCKPLHRDNVRALLAQAESCAGKAARARQRKAQWLTEAADLIGQATAYARFFRTGQRIPSDLSKLAEHAEAARRVEAARRAKAQAAQRAEDLERFEAWRTGDPQASCPYSFAEDETGSAYLRVVGEEVQTSRGARVPLEHARRALPIVLAIRAKGETWKRNGETIRLGHFQLDTVDFAAGIRAGCHLITWPHVEALARDLAVTA